MDFSSLNDDQLYELTQQAFSEAALRRWGETGNLADLGRVELAELGRLTWAEAETRGLSEDFEILLKGEVARINAAKETARTAEGSSAAQQRPKSPRSTGTNPSGVGSFPALLVVKALVLVLVTAAYFVLGDAFLQTTTGMGFVENMNQLPTVFSE